MYDSTVLAAVAPSICGICVKFVSSLPKVDSPTVKRRDALRERLCHHAGHARAVLRLDRETVDLVGVQERVDLVDLLRHVLLGLGRTQPRALDRVDAVRHGQRVVVTGLILLREALDRAGAVREHVVDGLMGLDLGDGGRREREGATMPQRDGPACRRRLLPPPTPATSPPRSRPPSALDDADAGWATPHPLSLILNYHFSS